MPEPGLVSVTRDAGVRVRTAQASDLDDLTAIESLAFASDRLSRRRLRALASSPTASFLVAESERILGYAIVLTRKGSGAARLYSLAVLPDLKGRGIGARLLKAAEAVATDRGAGSLLLEVRTDNADAIRFYKGHGYVPIGQREAYYADGIAALRFARDLRIGETRRAPFPIRRTTMSAAADG